jgi:hypothetical protein
MRETLISAIDVNGFRKHIQMRFNYLSDEDLLTRMHNERVKSQYQLGELRAESQRWLREHEAQGRSGS